jgi:thioredoxin reductase (NADPH)
MDFNLEKISTGLSLKKDELGGSPVQAKVLILGSGPGGLAAALYAARANLNPIVLTGLEHGGQVSLTYTVENYPGFPDGISGNQLVDLFQKQAERFGAHIEFERAVRVNLSQRPFKIFTDNSVYHADSLIITTGATSRHLEIPGEREFTGRGVSYCATCDGWFFKEKDVIVVGGGDSAIEESIFLTRYAKSVTVVHRRESLRASAILQKRAFEHDKIHFVWNSILTGVNGDEVVKSVGIRNVVTDEESIRAIDGVFVFIGHTPNTQLFEGQVNMDEAGYIKTDQLMQTNIPGVFAGGEAADPHYRQVITSAGMGAAAAMSAYHYLEEQS